MIFLFLIILHFEFLLVSSQDLRNFLTSMSWLKCKEEYTSTLQIGKYALQVRKKKKSQNMGVKKG
jgi:hypothetical protein